MSNENTAEFKLYNYLCEIGAIAIDTEIHEIRLIVYEELGLAGLTTEQIEELKIWLKAESTTLMFDYVAKNRVLQSENEQLKAELKRLHSDFGTQVEKRNSAEYKLEKLQSELKAAKSIRCDHCKIIGFEEVKEVKQ